MPVPEQSPKPKQDRPRPRLTYDPEWLAITRAFHPFLSTDNTQPKYPDEDAARLMITKELDWVMSNVKNKSDDVATGIRDIDDCQPFVKTAPGPGQEGDAMSKQRELRPVFLSRNLGIDGLNLINLSALVYEPTNGSILSYAGG